MKKAILIFTIATALGAAVFGSVFIPKKLKPAKQEFPTVIIPAQNESPHVVPTTQYLNEYTKFCPRENLDYKNASERYDYQTSNAEDSVVFVRHCRRCNIGVYSEHQNEIGKKCTYCGDKDPTDLAGE
jgi:hypothetical protein